MHANLSLEGVYIHREEWRQWGEGGGGGERHRKRERGKEREGDRERRGML